MKLSACANPRDKQFQLELSMSFLRLVIQAAVTQQLCRRWRYGNRYTKYFSSSSRPTSSLEGPGLKDFLQTSTSQPTLNEDLSPAPYLQQNQLSGNGRKGTYIIPRIKSSKLLSSVYFEIYGCQMNVNDADIAWTFLSQAGYHRTDHVEEVRNTPLHYVAFTYIHIHKTHMQQLSYTIYVTCIQ